MSSSVIVDFFSCLCVTLFSYFELIFFCLFPKKLKKLDNEVAIVTGCAAGIGRELALQLSRLGVHVVGWDINEEKLKETEDLVKSEGGKINVYVCDVSDKNQIQKNAQSVRHDVGNVTMLFNNAGIMPAKPFIRFEEEEVEEIFRVNTFSQIFMMQEYLPEFYFRNKGHVVSICSVAGIVGTPYLSIYCASKFAIKGLMDAVFLEQRKDHKNSNVKMTTVHPFTINTGLAVDPFTRFPSILPILEAKECAEIIIEGVRRDQESIYIPKILKPFFSLKPSMPRRAQLAGADFLDVGVGYQ